MELSWTQTEQLSGAPRRPHWKRRATTRETGPRSSHSAASPALDAAISCTGCPSHLDRRPNHGSLILRTSGSARFRGRCEARCRPDLQRVAGFCRVVVEHQNGFEGKISQIFPDSLKLRENIVRYGDDVAARIVRLKNLQQLA